MIGIIVKTDKEVEELEQDWLPETFEFPLFNEAFINALGYAPKNEEFCHESGKILIHFSIDDLIQPRAVTFNCTMSPSQSDIIKEIASMLGGRIYDSEAGTFV